MNPCNHFRSENLCTQFTISSVGSRVVFSALHQRQHIWKESTFHNHIADPGAIQHKSRERLSQTRKCHRVRREKQLKHHNYQNSKDRSTPTTWLDITSKAKPKQRTTSWTSLFALISVLIYSEQTEHRGQMRSTLCFDWIPEDICY